jgi:anaerobic magnesium-protoporphyrin IX monomethyl ester cyclase
MSLERKLSGKSITVELIHPPHPEASEDRLDAPLGLLYIAANLEKNGYQVCVNDLSGIKKSDWKIGLADVYGIAMYAPTMDISEEIARKCKEINPSSKTVAGGAHPTAIPSEIRSIFDSVIVGEGEAAMVDLVNDFPNIRPQYKRPLDRNLDLYPNAAYHLVDLKSYKRTFSGEQAITLLTSRGCPFRCSFCGLAEHHKTVKRRSPERVVEEIREIQKISRQGL